MIGASEKVEKLNSLMVAIVLLAPTLSGVLSNGFGISSGANLYILLAIFAVFMVKIFTEMNFGVRSKHGFTIMSALFLVSILLLYYITKYYYKDEMNYSFIQLLFYAIVPLIVIGFEINVEYVLRYCVYLSVLTVFGLEGFLAVRWGGYEQADLGKVYALVTVLVCVIFHMRFYYKKATRTIKIIYIYNLYVLVRVVMAANRGAMLALVFTVFVIFMYKFDDNDIMITQNIKKTVTIFVAVLAVFFVAQNLEEIMGWLRDFSLKVFGTVPSFITKMRSYIARDDISNGRSDINEMLFQSFKESPIYGHGLNMFYPYSKKEFVYPHNFIYQYFFEGGIVFSALPIFCSVGALVKVLLGTVKQKKEYILVSMLVCQCFPKLLLSSNVWLGTAIWMLIVYSANNLFFKRKK